MGKYLGIDYGARRVGLATADGEAKLASPLATVAPHELVATIEREGPFAAVVVGLPRSLSGTDTPQTLAVRRFCDDVLWRKLHIEPVYQDEAGTSSVAEDRLKEAGKPYSKPDIDAEAATIILQDYLDNPVKAKRRRLMLTGLIAAPLLIVGALYINYRLGLRPVATSGTAREFTVSAGENAPRIAQHLVDAGLLRSRNAFVTYVNFHGLRTRLKVGQYLIAPNLSGNQIADLLAGGRTLTKRLVIPEGYTLSQIKTLAVADGINAADLNAALAAPHTQSFLAGKPANVDLEGYLFPDSYQIDSTTTAATLVNDMLDTFGQRVGSEYVQAFAAEGLTLHQGLTLASIVEREVSNTTDRPIVAQIFLTRFKAGIMLGSDVTAKYASDQAGVPFNVDIDSPYNTRRYAGLPPGPICNPGLNSLDAAAHPANTDYLYFLAGKDGKTHFAKTYAEHQANIAKYL